MSFEWNGDKILRKTAAASASHNHILAKQWDFKRRLEECAAKRERMEEQKRAEEERRRRILFGLS